MNLSFPYYRIWLIIMLGLFVESDDPVLGFRNILLTSEVGSSPPNARRRLQYNSLADTSDIQNEYIRAINADIKYIESEADFYRPDYDYDESYLITGTEPRGYPLPTKVYTPPIADLRCEF
ncbi:hypothetical protein GE21DRAFT_1268680 [Neurospora crassa]|nr:hypothetical protein GE21DRAFT_1268680 [Neurospora crassa]